MIKKVIYFVLSVLAICYIGALVGKEIGIVNTANLGQFAKFVDFFIKYGGVALVFLYACTNFTGNIFKIVLFILLLLVTIIFGLVQIDAVRDFFRGILGL